MTLARFIPSLWVLFLLAGCSLPASLVPFATATPEFQPTAEIVRLANAATMTVKAQDLFYGARPEIDTDRALFEEHCQTPGSATTVELGCYTSDNRIYLLGLNDPQLQQMMIVTASHEMLHAAYFHFSDADRASLDAALEVEVGQIHDADLALALEQYRTSEPDARDNELHSIIGTEYAPLDDKLEQYYGQFFINRQAIVDAARQFKTLFNRLQSQMNSLQAQIEALRTQMNADRRRGSIRAYNALVPEFNALVRQYNQTVDQYNALSRNLVGEQSPATLQ